MMKYMKPILVLLMMIVPMFVMGAEITGTPVTVIVDGMPLALDQPAIMVQGRVMVPLRGVFESLGATVNYDPSLRSIDVSRGNSMVNLAIGSRQAIVNEHSQMLDVPPLLQGGRILVPLRFVSEAMGADVRWLAYNNIVDILSRTGGADLPLPNTNQTPTYNQNGSLIQSVNIYPEKVSPGQVVTVTMRGLPGGIATMSIGGQENIMMTETSTGYYIGTYTISSGLEGEQLDVITNLRMSDGRFDTARKINILTVNNANSSILPLSVISPNPASTVPQVFDVTGVTKPNAIVRIRVLAEKSFLGMIFGSRKDEVLSTQSRADSQGTFHFRVDTGNRASGTHLTMTLTALDTSGAFSNEVQIELTRQ